MKVFLSLVSVMLLASMASAQTDIVECDLAPMTCVVNDTEVQFDPCYETCCGGEIVDKEDDMECCGDDKVGSMYMPATQICCTHWYIEDVAVYDNTGDGEQCCGLELITNSMRNESACCGGWKISSVFNFFEEMCCGGRGHFVGDTSFGQCCGEVGYDRRIQSCPCGLPPLADVPVNEAKCCRSRDNSVTSAIANDEECCDGFGFDPSTHFCCDHVIGDSATQVCCNNQVVSSAPGVLGDGCCGLADGTSVQYDSATQVCCGGALLDIVDGMSACCTLLDDSTQLYNPATTACCGGMVQDLPEGEEAICCGGVLFLNPSDGDSCCLDSDGIGEVFNSNSSVCCSGVVANGDSCCGGTAYYWLEQVCCGGTIVGDAVGMAQPSCCVDQVFDSYVQTCCGATVYENPQIIDAEGNTNTSHLTRCCGDFGAPDTLRPYDYEHSLCCNGVIQDVGIEGVKSLECCGGGLFNPAEEACCDGVAYPSPDGRNASCASLVPEEEEEEEDVADEDLDVAVDAEIL